MRQNFLTCISAAAIAAGPALLPAAAQAQEGDYDIDCAVILCMAGGFPSGCGRAWDYMIDRITDTPPKPPYGVCTQSDGTEYTGAHVDWGYLSPTNRAAFVCPEGKSLYHSVSHEDHGRDRVTAFCYSGTTTIGYGDNRRTIYEGKSSPEQKNFQAHITVEPGTEAEYSPGLQKWWTDRLRGAFWNVSVRTY
jgi:hypothetical protein